MNWVVSIISFSMLILSAVGETPRCSCEENKCKAVHLFSVDFEMAQNMCRQWGGELMTMKSNASDEIIGSLLGDTDGAFWITLRRASGEFTNFVSMLKGSESTNARQTIESSNWMSENVGNTAHCVSVSRDRIWKAQLCTDKLTGFLCEDVKRNICKAVLPFRDPRLVGFFYNSRPNECMYGPCEHHCEIIPGGYMCSCGKDYIPRITNRHMCDYHCPNKTCVAVCHKGQNTCYCPEGFVLNKNASGTYCDDIDECEADSCAQKCENTFGSYVCSCNNTFRLVNKDKCIPIYVPTTPHSNHTMSIASFSTAGEFIGLAIFIIVAIFILVFLLRYLRMRTSDDHETQINPQNNSEI
ncbi:fibrillin-1-like [Chanos chanos]|uniref:Thrombomodulin n=1 Tax=Chanos chanos TaxID=29144 RepID=A0A6J2WA78_CHACN|nr:fibrillin-1-like [Chanos chanos]